MEKKGGRETRSVCASPLQGRSSFVFGCLLACPDKSVGEGRVPLRVPEPSYLAAKAGASERKTEPNR